jgi:hypothetical protein
LAAEIENRLRREDSGNTDISVSFVGTGSPASTTAGELKIVDATGRLITSATLVPSTPTGGTVSAVPVFTSGNLKITAIDPNVPAADINTAIALAQAGTPLAANAIILNSTPYPRSSAGYTFDTTSASFKATFGPDASPITVTANSVNAFVLALNSEATFSQSYVATFAGGVVTVTAKDPTTANAAAITGALKFFQGNGTSFTQINDLAAPNPIGNNGVPASPIFAGKKSIDDLKNLFSINVDNSIDPVTIGLDRLVGSNLRLSGAQIASELTNSINRAYGDEKPFNFTSLVGATFTIQLTPAGGATPPRALDIDLSQAGDDKHNMRYEDMVKATQAIVDANPSYAGKVKVSYDTVLQKLTFTSAGNDKITISSTQSTIGLTNPIVQGVNDESVGLTLAPSASTASYRAINDQRFGIKVEYDAVKGGFVFKSGATGDDSSVTVSNIKPNSLATQSSKGLGLTGDPANYVVTASKIDALRGTSSEPAVLPGIAWL